MDDKDELYKEKFANIWSKLKDHDQRIKSNEDDIENINLSFNVSLTKIASSLEKLEGLPKAVTAMEKSNEKVNISVNNLERTVDGMGKTIDGLEKKVESIDEEGKFNIRKFLQANWIPIGFGLTGVIAWALSLIK